MFGLAAGALLVLSVLGGAILACLHAINNNLAAISTTLTRKAASEALYRREQTYGALRDREHKGDGRG